MLHSGLAESQGGFRQVSIALRRPQCRQSPPGGLLKILSRRRKEGGKKHLEGGGRVRLDGAMTLLGGVSTVSQYCNNKGDTLMCVSTGSDIRKWTS